MKSYHTQLSPNLRLFFSLSNASCPSSKLHITYTNLSYVQSFRFYTHNCHFLPNCRILDTFHTLVSLIEISSSQKERKIYYWIFNDFVFMVNFLEIVKSRFLYEIVIFASLNRIEIWYFECHNIEYTMSEGVFILILNSSFWSIEKCEELSNTSFRFSILFLTIWVLLVSGHIHWLIGFIIISFIAYTSFGWFRLDSKIPWLFFIPINWNRNFFNT